MTYFCIGRRRLAAGVLVGLAFGPLSRVAWGQGLPTPAGKPILTVTGAISVTNEPQTAVFDRTMLEMLGSDEITTTTPWNDGPVHFEGVRLDKLMRTIGARGSVVTVYSLNDFSTKIPIEDFARFRTVLALKRNGEYMPVRDKGPLFVVYPYDSDAELKQQKYYNRSAWQVARMVVE